MRGFVIFVFVVGFLGALISGGGSPVRSHAGERVGRDAFADEANETAEATARNAPQFSAQDGNTLEIDRSPDGQFYADVRINGAPVHMMIDTGASEIALSRNDAQMAGVATQIGMNDVVGQGADGDVHGQYIKLDRVELGPLTAEGLPAIVLNSGGQSLLGQSFLSKFSSVHIEGDKMVLR